MHDTIVVIQSRMGSSRLPGKMTLPINGIPLFEFILRRLIGLKSLGAKIVLATSKDARNSDLVNIASRYDIDCYRGSEIDVFSRFVAIQNQFPNRDFIVRICGDNPFVDPMLVLELVRFIKSEDELDYAWNNVPRGIYDWPDGFGAECFSVKALKTASSLDLTMSNREHVTQIFYDETFSFNTGSYDPPFDGQVIPKMDIDSYEDYKAILDLIAKYNFGLKSSSREIIQVFNGSRENSRKIL